MNSKLIALVVSSVALLAIAYIGWNEIRKLKNKILNLSDRVSNLHKNTKLLASKTKDLQNNTNQNFR